MTSVVLYWTAERSTQVGKCTVGKPEMGRAAAANLGTGSRGAVAATRLGLGSNQLSSRETVLEATLRQGAGA